MRRVSRPLQAIRSSPLTAAPTGSYAVTVWAPPRSLAATKGILSFPAGTEMFQFPTCPPHQVRYPGRTPGGLPHSDTSGSLATSASPEHFAAWSRPSSAAGAKASTVRPSSRISPRISIIAPRSRRRPARHETNSARDSSPTGGSLHVNTPSGSTRQSVGIRSGRPDTPFTCQSTERSHEPQASSHKLQGD
jgi:hypothetical protein